MARHRKFPVVVLVTALAASSVPAAPAVAATKAAPIVAVGAENEYANVISQVGGPYVAVSAIMSNPNTDPHEFEASARVAETVSKAQLIVQNGVGYDSFMDKLEAASPSRGREVVVAQQLLGLASNIFNPHLWYEPRTMPLVARAVARDLSKMEPVHAAYFQARATRFVKSLGPWLDAIASFKKRYPRTPVAVTEPVADYMLQAVGAEVMTPEPLQSAIMNGTDPSPQGISLEKSLITGHKVKVFVYNQQVTDSVTATFLAEANQAHVPVVGVYETMPVPGYDYQSWMLAEVAALQAAVAKGTSTVRL